MVKVGEVCPLYLVRWVLCEGAVIVGWGLCDLIRVCYFVVRGGVGSLVVGRGLGDPEPFGCGVLLPWCYFLGAPCEVYCVDIPV
jgi:hypothetical protein